MNFKHSFYILGILLVFIGLIGCSSLIVSPPEHFDETQNAAYYLQQAKGSEGGDRTDWLLFSIQALIKENRLSAASQLLENLPKNLSVKQNRDKMLSIGEILVRTDKPFDLNYLDVKRLNMDQRARYYYIKLGLDKQNRNIDEQVHDYILIEKYSNQYKKNQIINNTWLFLSSLTQEQIQSIVIRLDDVILKGWIDLLNIYNKNKQSYIPQTTDTPQIRANKKLAQKEQLKQGIYNWAAYYSNHPARLLTEKLMGIKPFEVKDKNAKKVALLLPLNGGARIFGETIRQGYLDAMNFYPGEPEQNVIVLDTTSNSMSELVKLAKQQDATSIVGPLLKNEVQEIVQLDPTIPVLALNKIDNENSAKSNASNVCFFALSPEDEASDAANHIYEQHKIKPLLLVPRTKLGQRVAQRFTEQWQTFSGGVEQVYVQYFDGANILRANMNKGKGIDLAGQPIAVDSMLTGLSPSIMQLSQEQSAIGNSTLGQAPNFDAIYIYASYAELNLIKSMIEMNTSEPLSSALSPVVYASSQSHIANASTDFYFDMEGIQFADIPMIMSSSGIASKLPINVKNNYALARLYAMGIDAWRLTNRLNALISGRVNRFNGLTGRLSADDTCEIKRSLVWKQYHRGKITTLR